MKVEVIASTLRLEGDVILRIVKVGEKFVVDRYTREDGEGPYREVSINEYKTLDLAITAYSHRVAYLMREAGLAHLR